MHDDPASRAEQIRTAARYAQIVGPMPGSFSVAIRQLMLDEQAGRSALSEQSEFQVGRLLRGPSALAAIYFASRTFCSEQMRPGWLHTSLQLARLYRPSALAALLGFTYFYKRLGRVVHPDEWQYLSEPLQRHFEIAGLLGATFPAIGMTAAFLGAGMPYVALGAFLSHDRKGQGEYRRYLRMNRRFLDHDYEISRWGCTSIQVASAVMVGAGFGVEETARFDEGNMRHQPGHPAWQGPENPYATVRRWMNELCSHSAVSAAINRDEAATLSPEMSATLSTISKHGSQFRWMERKAADITPENTPDLLPDPSEALTRAQRKAQDKQKPEQAASDTIRS